MITFPDHVNITGTLIVGAFVPPNDSIGNEHVKSSDPLDHTKAKPRFAKHALQQSTVTSLVQHLHVAHTSGSIESLFRAALVTPCLGDSTIAVSIFKNGVNITSSPISLTSATGAYINVAGTINPSLLNYVAGDVFTAVVTATVGTGTLGGNLVVSAQFKENIP